VALAGATFVELEVNAKRLPLAVDQVAELATGAEGRFSIAKRLLVALSHVWMGLAEADDSGCLRLVSVTGAKGMGRGRNRPFVRVGA
jgi:hypothetical protein